MSIKTGGYHGKMLRVDLSTGKLTDEFLSDEILKNYIGGTLLGLKYMYDEVPADIGPFAPENRLVFTTGPFAGLAPATAVMCVSSKGPLTEMFGSAQMNGFMAYRLKSAGYDGIIIQGQSPSWKYLVINDGKAELKDASHLFGRSTYDTQDALRKELNLPKASVACIGPAGENKVRFANIFSDSGHFASSNGPGGVMGSKKLKAVVVFGAQKPPVFDEAKLKELSKEWISSSLAGPMASGVKALGTNLYYGVANMTGWLPTKNLTTDEFPEIENFLAQNVRARTDLEFKSDPCYKCHVGHCAVLKIKEGEYAGTVMDEPEYEGYAGFGGNLGNTNVVEAVMTSYLNDSMGMDLKECSFTLSWAIECYEKGYITKQDTGGLELTWGNVPVVKQLVKMIAHREGFGDFLAEGVYRCSQKIGGEAAKCAVYAKKGFAPHVHDPRGLWSYAFAQGVSDMGSIEGGIPDLGANPTIGYHEPIPPREADEHPAALAKGNGVTQFQDAVLYCALAGGDFSNMVETVNAITGWDLNVEDALRIGRKSGHLMRAFNIRCGETPDTDSISYRLGEAPINGPAAGDALGPVFDQMKRKYYQCCGWDVETSKPLPETLKAYDLEYAIKELWP